MIATSSLCGCVLVVLVSQILLDVGSGHPVVRRAATKSFLPKIPKRFKRSFQAVCPHKKHLRDDDGIITFNKGYRFHARDVSCSWIIHVTRGQLAQYEFSKFNIEDSCPGICQCNYVAIRENIGGMGPIIRRYCNERRPPRGLISGSEKVRIHLRLKAGSQTSRTSFTLRYATMSDEKPKQARHEESEKDKLSYYLKKHSSNHGNDASKVRVRKLVPSSEVTDVTRSAQPTKDPEPSKLTILLAVAIPVVLIFIFVVLLIAYYNYYIDKKLKESGEEIPKTGATISDMILNSSVTLTPMFNLGKARRESSNRKEKANKLYDDMLQNWRQMNDTKKQREKAKEESVNTWESYKKYKQRRNTRDVEENNNEAFAMLVSNAINVATNPHSPDSETTPEVDTTEEVGEKPRTSSILIKRTSSSESLRHSRGSKVLSWSDISTSKPKEESETSRKRTKSETELKTTPSRGSGSTHIPAIVVSQPSIETEDDESEANDTDRLIKDDKDGAKKSTDEPSQAKSDTTTYSCSEHVKDILRESYGEEIEELFQKPTKTGSQGSLQHVPDSNVKYQAMKPTDGDEGDDDDDID